MVTSLSMRSNQTSKNTSQEELRDLMGKSPAVHRFLTLFRGDLERGRSFRKDRDNPFAKKEGGPRRRTALYNSTRAGSGYT